MGLLDFHSSYKILIVTDLNTLARANVMKLFVSILQITVIS
jgi:hypothetical protein